MVNILILFSRWSKIGKKSRGRKVCVTLAGHRGSSLQRQLFRASSALCLHTNFISWCGRTYLGSIGRGCPVQSAPSPPSLVRLPSRRRAEAAGWGRRRGGVIRWIHSSRSGELWSGRRRPRRPPQSPWLLSRTCKTTFQGDPPAQRNEEEPHGSDVSSRPSWRCPCNSCCATRGACPRDCASTTASLRAWWPRPRVSYVAWRPWRSTRRTWTASTRWHITGQGLSWSWVRHISNALLFVVECNGHFCAPYVFPVDLW